MLVLCVCLSVCPLRDLKNGTLYRRTSFAGVKRFSWQVAQTPFPAYTMCELREKDFGNSRQVTHWRQCTDVTPPSYLGQDESYPLLERLWNILEGQGYHT